MNTEYYGAKYARPHSALWRFLDGLRYIYGRIWHSTPRAAAAPITAMTASFGSDMKRGSMLFIEEWLASQPHTINALTGRGLLDKLSARSNPDCPFAIIQPAIVFDFIEPEKPPIPSFAKAMLALWLITLPFTLLVAGLSGMVIIHSEGDWFTYVFIGSNYTYPVSVLVAFLSRRKRPELVFLPCLNIVLFFVFGAGMR